MSVGYTFETLVCELHKKSPALTDFVARHRRDAVDGLLSVGLKLHYLGHDPWFDELVEALSGDGGGVLWVNGYKKEDASLCLVLPPVGSARVAIGLIKAIEQYINYPLFDNPYVQIQVCSPGQLDKHHCAIHGAVFYLASERIRRFCLENLETTFSKNGCYPRGRRLILYDANGDFDPGFPWWSRVWTQCVIRETLPLPPSRTDVLTATLPSDIENINLTASLLVHAQYAELNGYWRQAGRRFGREAEALLNDYGFRDLLNSAWVNENHEKDTAESDVLFSCALQKLVAHAFAETKRFSLKLPSRGVHKKGLLQHMQELVGKYRALVREQSKGFRSFQEKGDG